METEYKIIRMPEDTYSIEEVRTALEASRGFLAVEVIEDVLNGMETWGLDEVPKKRLSETEFECLDWALFSVREQSTQS